MYARRLTVVCTLALVCSSYQESAAQFTSLAQIYGDSLGNTLPYRLFLPPGHDAPGAEFPIVVHLHGAGERGTNNTSQLSYIEGLIEATQTDHPAYLLVPQAPNGDSWARFGSDNQLTQSSQLTIDLIGELEGRFGIDSSRRYVTGLSMGGFGSYDLIAKLPGFFDAAAPLSAYGDPSRAPAYADTRIWTMHGSADTIVRVEPDRATIQAIRDAGGSPLYTETPDGHGGWSEFYDDPFGELYDWMFDDVSPPLVEFLYDPATGAVEIDAANAPGGTINLLNLVLNRNSPLFDPTDPMTAPEFVYLDGTPIAADDLIQVRGTASLVYTGAGGGLSGKLQIPGLMPKGLDFLTLSELTLRQYYQSPGTGDARRYFMLNTGAVNVVPEPSAALLAAGGVLLLAVRRRR